MKDCRLKRILKKILRKYRRVCKHIDDKYAAFYVKHCPLKKNKIVFDNFGGKGFGDNPRYIAEEIIKQGLNWEMVWIVSDMDEPFPPQIRKVKQGSNKAAREWASAKMWVDNIRNTRRPLKKQGQVYLQTWHGSILVKKVEKDVETKLAEKYVSDAKYDGSITDGIISHDSGLTGLYKSSFWLNDRAEILETGSPKENIFFRPDEMAQRRKNIQKQFGLNDGDYVVLYAPTFRKDSGTDVYRLDFDMIRKAFEKKTGRTCRIIIRLHPNVSRLCTFMKYDDNILNGSFVSDFVDLSILADCVITDVSSCFCEFLLQNKPVFLCIQDMEDYKSDRDLYEQFWDYPLLLSETSEGLVKQIEETDMDEYTETVKAYLKEHPYFVSANTCELIVEWLKNKQISL